MSFIFTRQTVKQMQEKVDKMDKLLGNKSGGKSRVEQILDKDKDKDKK